MMMIGGSLAGHPTSIMIAVGGDGGGEAVVRQSQSRRNHGVTSHVIGLIGSLPGTSP